MDIIWIRMGFLRIPTVNIGPIWASCEYAGREGAMSNCAKPLYIVSQSSDCNVEDLL